MTILVCHAARGSIFTANHADFATAFASWRKSRNDLRASPHSLKPVERPRACAEDRLFLAIVQVSGQGLGGGVPARVIAVEVQHRPVASPHQALGSKILQQMIDVR